ncbi:MAG: sporulation protein [Chloroflexi bacterium]|nr:MAG: sporulation protein [Chloroflexota bacterium]
MTAEHLNTEGALAEVTRIAERANAAACFGTAVVSGDRTVIPVADIMYGFGVGFGGSEPHEMSPGGHGGGGGGGARTRAIAVIEVAPNGVRIIPIEDQTSIRMAAIAFASAATAILARTLLKLIRG